MVAQTGSENVINTELALERNQNIAMGWGPTVPSTNVTLITDPTLELPRKHLRHDNYANGTQTTVTTFYYDLVVGAYIVGPK